MSGGITLAGRGGGVSSSLAVLMAALIIFTASIAFLVVSLYSTSIISENVEVERLMQKSREVIKLVIMKEVVREGGSVRYPVRIQLKNAWSGTSEITYIVVLDRGGNVLYERSADPPLTLYATEIRFMKPSDLMLELSQYDEDWYRMRQEIGLIILHTRLGNRFTSIYENPAGSGGGGEAGDEDITLTYITSTPTTTTTPIITKTTSTTATQTITTTTSVTATSTSTTTITSGMSVTQTTTTPTTTTTTTRSLTSCTQWTLTTGHYIAGTVTVTHSTVVITETLYTYTTPSCTFTKGYKTVWATITVPTTSHSLIERTTCKCTACPASVYGAAIYIEPNRLFYAPYVGGFLITLFLVSIHEKLLKRRSLILVLTILMIVGVATSLSKTSSITITVTVTEPPVTVTAPTTTITETYTSTTTLTTTTRTTPTTTTVTVTKTTPSTTQTITVTAPTSTVTVTTSSIVATDYRCILTRSTVTLTLWTVSVSTYTLSTGCTTPGLWTVWATVVSTSTNTMWWILGYYSVNCA